MIRLTSVSKGFLRFQVIKSISLSVKQGEIYGIVGASGAGKSTLLRLINLLELPDDGEVEVNGQLLTSLGKSELRQARKSIGMIFQQFNLLSNKSVYDNVLIALQLVDFPRSERSDRVMECLRFVGLEHIAKQYPAQLSGGQKQRVAIARALASNPRILLCDEPTSSLDEATTGEILSVLEKVNKELGVTIVIVSHELDVIKSICSRVSVMAAGEIYETVDIKPRGIQQLDKSPQSLLDKLKKEV